MFALFSSTHDMREILAVFRAAVRQLAAESDLEAIYFPHEVYPRCMLATKKKRTIAELSYTPITGFRYTINGGTVWCGGDIMLADFIVKFLTDARKRLKRCRFETGPCFIKWDMTLKEVYGSPFEIRDRAESGNRTKKGASNCLSGNRKRCQ